MINPTNQVLVHTVYDRKWTIISVVGQGCVSVPSVSSPGGGLYANPNLSTLVFRAGKLPHPQIDSLLFKYCTVSFCSSGLIFFRPPPGVTRTRSFKTEVSPRSNRLVSARIPSLSVGLCRPSLPSLCNYVPACRKAVFHRLPVRRVPGWPQNLRGVVRQTGRQQGRKSGCVRVESWSGCDGHQIWERSGPGRVKERGGRVQRPMSGSNTMGSV